MSAEQKLDIKLERCNTSQPITPEELHPLPDVLPAVARMLDRYRNVHFRLGEVESLLLGPRLPLEEHVRLAARLDILQAQERVLEDILCDFNQSSLLNRIKVGIR